MLSIFSQIASSSAVLSNSKVPTIFLFLWFCLRSSVVIRYCSGAMASCFSPICLMYLRSFLSYKPAAAINPSGLSSNPAKNHKVPSWPLSEATLPDKNAEKSPKTITTTKAITIQISYSLAGLVQPDITYLMFKYQQLSLLRVHSVILLFVLYAQRSLDL